jgi:hypothetical protein
MDNFVNTILTNVDRLSRGLGPINTVVDRLVSRIAPQTSAKAGCGSFVYYYCSGFCPSNGRQYLIEVYQTCNISHPCVC